MKLEDSGDEFHDAGTWSESDDDDGGDDLACSAVDKFAVL
jgi:hypothetical protein